MPWEVEYTDEFGQWWQELSEGQQDAVAARVELLMEYGPNLPYPYSSDIRGSRHGVMRELRAQSGGRPLRVFYAFDPRRTLILLIGGDKTGNDRFYEEYVPVADSLYDEHLEELRKGGADRMSGRHPFSELTSDFTPERRRRIDEMKRELLAEMPLHELRSGPGADPAGHGEDAEGEPARSVQAVAAGRRVSCPACGPTSRRWAAS